MRSQNYYLLLLLLHALMCRLPVGRGRNHWEATSQPQKDIYISALCGMRKCPSFALPSSHLKQLEVVSSISRLLQTMCQGKATLIDFKNALPEMIFSPPNVASFRFWMVAHKLPQRLSLVKVEPVPPAAPFVSRHDFRHFIDALLRTLEVCPFL